MFTDEDVRSGRSDGLIAWTPFAVWILLAGWLGFGAYAKFISPNPHERMFDLTQAVLEIAVIVAVLLAHRWRVAWMCVSMMFAGFAGWGMYAYLNSVSCGCFGKLWTPPAWVSTVVALVFVGLGIAMALNRAAKRDMLVVTAVGALVAGAAGYFAYDLKKTGEDLREARSELTQNSETIAMLKAAIESGESGAAASVDPCLLKYDDSPIGRVMKLESNRDLCRLGPADPAWVIIIHDEHCHVCENAKYSWDPMMDEMAEIGDLVMQVRQFEINELEAETGIEAWNWDETPNFFVIRNGEILGEEWQWRGEDWPVPGEVRDRLEAEFFSGSAAGE